MRPIELFFVFLVQYCFIDGLSGLNWNQYDSFNPEEHENYKLLPPKDSCGTNVLVTQTENEKIVGGYETKLGEIPWIVQYGEKRNGEFYSTCGGNLISERYVLLAASCLMDIDKAFIREIPAEPYVRLGEWNTTGDPDSQGDLHAPPVQDIEIDAIIRHNNFNCTKGGSKNDIALIRLKTPTKLNDFVQPVCLPYGAAMSKDFTNEDTIVAGWGGTKATCNCTGPFPPILNAVNLKVTDGTKCSAAWNAFNNNDQICPVGEEGKNIRNRDEGGPLLWKGSFEPNISSRTYLLGVASFFGLKDSPAVFTRTNFFMKWILDNMRE